MQFSQSSFYFSLSHVQIFPSVPCSYSRVKDQVSHTYKTTVEIRLMGGITKINFIPSELLRTWLECLVLLIIGQNSDFHLV
jgi:hypothetical protein